MWVIGVSNGRSRTLCTSPPKSWPGERESAEAAAGASGAMRLRGDSDPMHLRVLADSPTSPHLLESGGLMSQSASCREVEAGLQAGTAARRLPLWAHRSRSCMRQTASGNWR